MKRRYDEEAPLATPCSTPPPQNSPRLGSCSASSCSLTELVIDIPALN